MSEQLPEDQTPEEELDINEPEEYTTEPEDDTPQDPEAEDE